MLQVPQRLTQALSPLLQYYCCQNEFHLTMQLQMI
jgi:hypothetical protein